MRFEAALLCITVLTACGPTPPTTLTTLATARGMRMGTFVLVATDTPAPRYTAALREFNLLKVPTFFRLIENEKGVFDFTIPDHVAELVPATTPLQLHGLIGCDLNPDWLDDSSLTTAELTSILNRHLTAVIEHYREKYPERIFAWDIVNEPMNGWGAGCPWHRIGLDNGLDRFEYIRIALRTARALLPTGRLFLNDFGVEDRNAKSDELLGLISDLKAHALVVDGVGFESHFMMETGGPFPQAPPSNDVKDNLNRFASLGLETNISEADFSIIDSDLSAATLEKQAVAYRDLLHACLTATNCKAFTTWGVGDADSWIPTDFAAGWGHPLLFDQEYAPKPAYSSVSAELSKRQK